MLSLGILSSLFERESDRKMCSLTGSAFYFYGAVVLLDYPVCHGQSEPCSSLLCCKKGIENPTQIFIRNTFTGIRQVDPAVIEVATGMGMTPRQILLSVELPLSLPVIMAGIRISTVWTIGVATLCGLIGAGGLGDLILKGLRSIKMDYLIAGTVPAAILALVFDGILARVEAWLTPEGMRARSRS